MIALSSLLRYKLVDRGSHTVKADDFVVDIPVADVTTEGDPPVTFVLWHEPGTGVKRLPWTAVKGWHGKGRQIRVDSLEAGEPVDPNWLERAVLLKRDLLDAIMLDLKDRRPVLANDLWLVEKEKQLQLKAVDVGLVAILRRVSRGRLRLINRKALRDWEHIEFFHGDLRAAGAGFEYHGLIQRLPPGEIAYLADYLPYLYAAELLTFLPETIAADVLEVMMPTHQLQAFEELDADKAGRILEIMRPDIIADLLSRLDNDDARRHLEHFPRKLYNQVIQLLRYPDDTAGGIMNNDIITLPADITAKKALSILVDTLESPVYQNIIQLIFVIDSETGKKLRGVLSLRDLLVANGNTRLEDIMNSYLVTLSPLAPARDAARRVIESGLIALPVVTQDGQIAGAVTVDTALALIVPKTGGREVFRLFT